MEPCFLYISPHAFRNMIGGIFTIVPRICSTGDEEPSSNTLKCESQCSVSHTALRTPLSSGHGEMWRGSRKEAEDIEEKPEGVRTTSEKSIPPRPGAVVRTPIGHRLGYPKVPLELLFGMILFPLGHHLGVGDHRDLLSPKSSVWSLLPSLCSQQTLDYLLKLWVSVSIFAKIHRAHQNNKGENREGSGLGGWALAPHWPWDSFPWVGGCNKRLKPSQIVRAQLLIEHLKFYEANR